MGVLACVEAEVFEFLGGDSDIGVVGGSLLFERGGAEAMGRVDFDLIFRL